MVVEKARCQAFQTTVSTQPIRENGIVNITTIKASRSLIACKNLSQYDGRSAYDSTVFQLDLEAWLRKIPKHTAVIFIKGYFLQCERFQTLALLHQILQSGSVDKCTVARNRVA
jgi:hypothetical protein